MVVGRKLGAVISRGYKKNPWEVEREHRKKLSYVTASACHTKTWCIYPVIAHLWDPTTNQLSIWPIFFLPWEPMKWILLYLFYRWIRNHESFALVTTARVFTEAFKDVTWLEKQVPWEIPSALSCQDPALTHLELQSLVPGLRSLPS